MDNLAQQVYYYAILECSISSGCLSATPYYLVWNQEWLWPEGKVLYYNIVLNKSSNWGVMPWAWYFYSALPRAMFVSIFLVPLGVFLDRRTMVLVVPSILFVFLYSFLPHKELRFIIYVFPLLNVAAAEACKRFWESAKKKQTFFRRLFALGAVLHIVANVIFSSMMLYISSNNYPGKFFTYLPKLLLT